MTQSDGPERTVPIHLGLILDGNRRWARAHGLSAQQGHRQGYETLHEIVRAAASRGVKYISAYTFSTENWQRAQEEVDFLMDLMVWVATKEIDRFIDEGFRVLFVGSRQGLSPKVMAAIESAEFRTANNNGAVLVLCFNYGGQQELADAATAMAAAGLKPAQYTPEKMGEYLYHPEIPPLDMIIRTSGEQRLSGFMLWRAAYAELYFTDVLWPDFTAAELDKALEEYARRQRRFGK